MKTAAELEQELIRISKKISTISVQIGRSEPRWYREHPDFRSIVDEYQQVFDQMYKLSEVESYFWRYCSYDVYRATFDERREEFNKTNDKVYESFLGCESRGLELNNYFPFILGVGYDADYQKYRLHNSHVSAEYYANWKLKSTVLDENYKKEKYIQKWSDYEHRILREKEEEFDRLLDDEFSDSFLLESETDGNGKSTIVIDDKTKIELTAQIEKKQAASLEAMQSENVVKAKSKLIVLSGYWINGERILKPEEYVVLEKELECMIKEETLKMPTEVIRKTPASAQFISRLFWLIHKDLYGTRKIKDYFVMYMISKFLSFDTRDFNSVKKHFSEDPQGVFDKHFAKCMKTVK